MTYRKILGSVISANTQKQHVPSEKALGNIRNYDCPSGVKEEVVSSCHSPQRGSEERGVDGLAHVMTKVPEPQAVLLTQTITQSRFCT